ncbi:MULTISPECIES: L,D-transpeptidase [unclassified Aureimonas]|uniref:L,D-transpeptidase n=1 Tax=unclassified Aureimonas TaxID=2615206 RepID=UPI0006FA89A6|nr:MULTISPECIES: L,D-transpeptidase [unclassified Aureimonas]KQT69594.1 hypothetical protein ASG62_00145 [Aureimonas sp. Leaf427]KQT80944.1 hypothetical protein ASG54_05670 [Aureimonas sp. Leaf460]
MRLLALLMLAAGLSAAALLPAGAASARYGALRDKGVMVPAVPLDRIERRFQRQSVSYVSEHPAGTIVVDPARHFLYLIEAKGRALRYGVSVGKGAFAWSGQAVIGRIAPWPRWTPPAEMVQRSPSLSSYQMGLDGGMFNPLGARALYLYQGRKDTLYRIHGTSEWWSIGDDASSGCIRMLNQDVIDLASRVGLGATVVVLSKGSPVRRRP